ncbi:MAG: pro-sigmaK processing inhibitor BofA family protein [Gallicola sp.]|nr:pro-sigmaK processing inhibitor BofA family protein [Gallicola sp.]
MEIIVLLGGTIIGIFILWLLAKIFSISFKILLKLVFNALGGAVILLLFNLVGGLLGVGIHITFINALIAGIFGIPGVIFLLILQIL